MHQELLLHCIYFHNNVSIAKMRALKVYSIVTVKSNLQQGVSEFTFNTLNIWDKFTNVTLDQKEVVTWC